MPGDRLAEIPCDLVADALPNEDHLCGDERLSQHEPRDARLRQREIGPDPAVKECLEGAGDDVNSTQNRGDQRKRDARGQPPFRKPHHAQKNVAADQQAEHRREAVQPVRCMIRVFRTRRHKRVSVEVITDLEGRTRRRGSQAAVRELKSLPRLTIGMAWSYSGRIVPKRARQPWVGWVQPTSRHRFVSGGLHPPHENMGRCYSGRIPLRLFFLGISERVDPGIELAGGDVLGRMRRGDDGRSRTGEEAGKLETPAAQGHQEHHAQDHEAPVEQTVRFRHRGALASGGGGRRLTDLADQHGRFASDVTGLVLHDLQEVAVEDDSLGHVGTQWKALGSLLEVATVSKLGGVRSDDPGLVEPVRAAGTGQPALRYCKFGWSGNLGLPRGWEPEMIREGLPGARDKGELMMWLFLLACISLIEIEPSVGRKA